MRFQQLNLPRTFWNSRPVCHKMMHQAGNGGDHISNVSWFPQTISDLDRYQNEADSAEIEQDIDHPIFTDLVYRARRNQIVSLAVSYKHDQDFPVVNYTDEEIKTWKNVYQGLTKLYPTHACKEFNDTFPELSKACGYEEDKIPKLSTVSNYLKSKTGFTLRPAGGFINPRVGLAALAFRIFFCTQYIRHPSQPGYTPEPDICHEMMGHIPLLLNPDFANFAQEVGLMSFGITDEWVEKLANIFWFSGEIGVCREQGELKAYGGALLSSSEELQHCIESDQCERVPFDPDKACTAEYPTARFQHRYYVGNSLKECIESIRSWMSRIPRLFSVQLNQNTQRIEIIQNKERAVLNCI